MCDYSGCSKKPVYEIQQLVGKKQTLAICESCAPKWVKDLTPSKFYQARKIGGDWVRGNLDLLAIAIQKRLATR